jgi:riboflavin biosynthesis pyrimidine reductase
VDTSLRVEAHDHAGLERRLLRPTPVCPGPILSPAEGPVLSPVEGRELVIPDALQGKVRLDAGAPQERVARLSAEGKTHLYIDGGRTIQRFLQAGLIDEITLTQIPLLLGAGIPLFGALDVEVPLRLVDVTRSDNGFVQVRYKMGSGA